MNHDDEENALHASMADFILHERRLNDERAAQAARAFIEKIRAAGFSVRPEIEEATTLRVLKLLNEHLEREAGAVAKRMETSEPATPPQLLH
jgi:hypothetical protein